MKKVLLLCVTSQDIYNFRLPLIKALIERGCIVQAVAFDDKYENELNIDGCQFLYIKNNNRSTNPLSLIALKKVYKKIIKEFNPEIVLTFMVKPNVIGPVVSHKLGVKKIYCVVEGAGEVFGGNSFRMKLLKKIECFFYKRSFCFADAIFFLNGDDKEEFLSLKLLKPFQAKMINGIGVDLEKFPLSDFDYDSESFVMAARMLKTKGVVEYCECARVVKQFFPHAIFYYLGSEDELTEESIRDYIANKSINYCGNVKDVRPYISKSIAFVLPSYYREGLPMSIMEAESMGRCIITTDNIGCRDTVVDNINGFLVKPKSIDELVEKCLMLLKDKELAKKMGLKAREYAEKNYDQRVVNESFLTEIGI